MHWFKRHSCVLAFGKRATAALLVACLFHALFPIQVQLSGAGIGKYHSQAFRCQDRACGCRTVEHCRTKCCCSSSGPKLTLTFSSSTTSPWAVSAIRAGKSDVTTSLKSCCLKRMAKSLNADAILAPGTDSAPKQKFVLAIAEQECRGVAQTFSGAPVFTLPAGLAVRTLIEPTGERIVLFAPQSDDVLPDPPVPPPRLVAA